MFDREGIFPIFERNGLLCWLMDINVRTRWCVGNTKGSRIRKEARKIYLSNPRMSNIWRPYMNLGISYSWSHPYCERNRNLSSILYSHACKNTLCHPCHRSMHRSKDLYTDIDLCVSKLLNCSEHIWNVCKLSTWKFELPNTTILMKKEKERQIHGNTSPRFRTRFDPVKIVRSEKKFEDPTDEIWTSTKHDPW
jgi:hypothetical protein